MLLVFLLTICVLFESITCSFSEGALAKTKSGYIWGSKSISRSGRPYVAFKGIQYGVVKERFEEAVEPKPWLFIKDTLKFGSDCAQLNALDQKMIGDENCLFLNVYAPQIFWGNVKQLKPVIFYIHGGGFVQGNGRYGEKYFMDEDVILVTINYRLGSFGFLALEGIPNAPDNLGFRDQLLALKWVKENIQNFGGDPKRVTLMGESAGAASVAYFTLSNLTSTDLFHGAIQHSSAILNNWVWWPMDKSQATAKKIGTSLLCDTSTNVKLLKCLKEKNASTIIQAQANLTDFYLDPFISISPVAGNPASTAFLSGIPEDLIRSGKFHRVPMIFTACEKEGLTTHAASIIGSQPHIKELDENWVKNGFITGWFPQDARLRNLTDANKKKIMTEVRNHYFGNRTLMPFDPWTLNRLEEFYTDRNFLYGIRESARIMSEFTQVYLGLFTDVGADSITNKVFGHPQSLGMGHVDDLQFFFDDFGVGPFPLTPKLTEYSQELVKIWVNFAKTGIPSGTVNGAKFNWRPIAKEEREVKNNLLWLNLGIIPNLLRDPFGERLQIWDELYKYYGKK